MKDIMMSYHEIVSSDAVGQIAIGDESFKSTCG